MRYKKCDCEKTDANTYPSHKNLQLFADEYSDSLLSFYYFYCKNCSRIWQFADCDFGNSWTQINWKELHNLLREIVDLPKYKCDFNPK